MKRTKIVALCLVLLIVSNSCSKSLPDELPGLGLSFDELEMNTYITITAPKQLNSQTDDSIDLEIKNNSADEWNFDITKDILIYELHDEEWKKVSDKMINIWATKLTLGPKGEFPLDNRIIGIIPDVKADNSAYLRIVLLVHRQTSNNEELVKGAFVDVLYRP